MQQWHRRKQADAVDCFDLATDWLRAPPFPPGSSLQADCSGHSHHRRHHNHDTR